MNETVKFKKFIPLDDKDILDKIHLNYRLSYLKDTALATGLDESNLQMISNMISSNNSDIIQSILLNQESISQIFERLRTSDTEARKEAINFISEIFSISKNLQVQGRLNLMSSFKSIEEYNLSILVRECITFKEDILTSSEVTPEQLDEANRLVTNSLDILLTYLQSFPVTLSEMCHDKASDESEKLLRSLVEHLLSSDSQGVKLQIHEMLRFLLENDTNLTCAFYDTAFKLFADYFTKEPKENDREYNDTMEMGKMLAVDLINKAIIDDNYNAKMYINKYSIIDRINKMQKFSSKILNMSIIKFHKCLLLTGFKPYVTEMIKTDLLDPVVEIFDKITNKRNLIASIVLELFSIIEKKSQFELAKHLFDKHEVVRPFLKKCAELHQPKVSFRQPGLGLTTVLDWSQETRWANVQPIWGFSRRWES